MLGANPDYRETRAVTEPSGGAMNQAREDALRASKLDRRDVLSAYLLAISSFFAGEYDAGSDAVDAAIALNGKVPDLWLLKSALELGRGDRAAAANALEEAVQSDPRRRSLAGHPAARRNVPELSLLDRTSRSHARDGSTGAREPRRRRETSFTLGRSLPPAPPSRGRVSVEGTPSGREMYLRVVAQWVPVPEPEDYDL